MKKTLSIILFILAAFLFFTAILNVVIRTGVGVEPEYILVVFNLCLGAIFIWVGVTQLKKNK